MAGNLFTSLVKRLRQVASSFNEKPAVKAEDYVLEHFMLYHGLVGSTPENQRSFKDVRADIFEAIGNSHSLQLAIALKLPPLWWDEKLKAIIAEVNQPGKCIQLLLPEIDDNVWPNNHDPLGHTDWQVRANAAMLLASLNAKQADERMARSLNDTADNAKAAFCHIAQALGKLDTPVSKTALRQYLTSDEPWFCVDAAGASAACSGDDVMNDLSRSMLQYHELRDYMAVAISRQRSLLSFFESENELWHDGGCALVLGILEASRQTFTEDIVADAGVPECLPALQRSLAKQATPLRVRALRELTKWMIANYNLLDDSLESLPTLPELTWSLKELDQKDFSDMLSNALEKSTDEHAIRLIRELGLKALAPKLIDLINWSENNAAAKDGASTDNPIKNGATDQLIETLGALGDIAAVAPLIKIARCRVDVKERTEKAQSKHPIAEENQHEAKTYWRVLQALGNLPAPDSISFLLECTKDYAPDKREQALASLIGCAGHSNGDRPVEIKEAIAQGLDDASPQVCVAALNGIAKLQLLDFVDSAITMVNAKQTAINKQASKTVIELGEQGFKKEVGAFLEQRIAKESDQFRRQKLAELLTSI